MEKLDVSVEDNKLVVQYSPVHIKAYSINELRTQLEECEALIANLLTVKEFWRSKIEVATRLGIKE
jgi:hypothetical protein